MEFSMKETKGFSTNGYVATVVFIAIALASLSQFNPVNGDGILFVVIAVPSLAC